MDFIQISYRSSTTRRKLSDVLVEGVHRHIKSFQTIPSHYCRKSTSKQYLPSELNIKQMYRLYVQCCEAESSEPVKESMYRNIFTKNYNISFQSRKKIIAIIVCPI